MYIITTNLAYDQYSSLPWLHASLWQAVTVTGRDACL